MTITKDNFERLFISFLLAKLQATNTYPLCNDLKLYCIRLKLKVFKMPYTCKLKIQSRNTSQIQMAGGININKPQSSNRKMEWRSSRIWISDWTFICNWFQTYVTWISVNRRRICKRYLWYGKRYCLRIMTTYYRIATGCDSWFWLLSWAMANWKTFPLPISVIPNFIKKNSHDSELSCL